jgi:acetyl-CoA carboxylase biotin carboxyl carrier protein
MTNSSASTVPAAQICDWLAGTGIELFELRGPGTLLRLQRSSTGYEQAPEQEAATPEPVAAADIVRSGSVGVLRHAHPLRTGPLVQAGEAVIAGQALAVLQIGAVLLAVPAPRDGVVARVLAADGAIVGYGEALVELE